MAVGNNSYGTVAQVVALTRMYTSSGSYNASTNPTLTQVEGFIDQVSSIVNVALAAEGFVIPVAQADAAAALATMVIEAAAELCRAANNAGRFYTERAIENGVSPMRAIRNEIRAWVEENAAGLEKLGASRSTSNTGSIAFRDADESGATVPPLFSRKGFGETYREWDQ